MGAAILLFTAIAVIRLAARGTDFLIGPGPSLTHFPADVGSAEVRVWGITALVTCAVMLLAALIRSNLLAVYGCLAGSAFYVMFAVFVFSTTLGANPPTDWRIFFDYVGSAANWQILAAVYFVRYKIIKEAA